MIRKFGGHRTYEIQRDACGGIEKKAPLFINYKTELPLAYTPVFIFHEEGEEVGLLDKTEYYRDYGGPEQRLILEVREVYVLDDTDPTLPYTAWPALSRVKTWVHVNQGTGELDEDNTKARAKLYNTFQKSHTEGCKRRANVQDQLTTNVATAGILSEVFADQDESYNSLVDLQTLHAAAFSSWMNSGRGPLYDDILNDLTTTWLSETVADNEQTRAVCPWMIGETFRDYIIKKLKGEIR